MREGCERTLVPYSVPRRTAYRNNRDNENSQKNPRPPCFKYWPEEFKIELLQARSFRAEVFEAAPIAVFWEAVERLLAPFRARQINCFTFHPDLLRPSTALSPAAATRRNIIFCTALGEPIFVAKIWALQIGSAHQLHCTLAPSIDSS